MADTTLDIRAQAYGRNILQLAQQKQSKLFSKVFVKSGITGKTFFQDRIGQWAMSTKAAPNATTPENDPNLSRRMAFIKTEHDARLLDRSLNLQVLSDPKSEMTTSASMSIGRAMDDEIIAKLLASANTGEDGSGSVALPSAQIILNGAANLTFDKVKQANRIFDDADVEKDNRCFVVSPGGIESLLSSNQVTSSDYTTIQAIQNGSFDGKTWMGFEWVMSTRLPVAGDIHSGIAFQKNAFAYGMTDSPFVRASERDDRSFSHQVYYEINHGGVRLEEERVVQVDYDVTA